MTEIDTIPAWPMQRRSMLFGAMAALAGTAANAQTGSYPSGPVRLITPSPAGSLLDVMARLYGQEMGNMLRQPFVVDGKPGAGGIIAAVFGAFILGFSSIFTGLNFIVTVSDGAKSN